MIELSMVLAVTRALMTSKLHGDSVEVLNHCITAVAN